MQYILFSIHGHWLWTSTSSSSDSHRSKRTAPQLWAKIAMAAFWVLIFVIKTKFHNSTHVQHGVPIPGFQCPNPRWQWIWRIKILCNRKNIPIPFESNGEMISALLFVPICTLDYLCTLTGDTHHLLRPVERSCSYWLQWLASGSWRYGQCDTYLIITNTNIQVYPRYNNSRYNVNLAIT